MKPTTKQARARLRNGHKGRITGMIQLINYTMFRDSHLNPLRHNEILQLEKAQGILAHILDKWKPKAP